MSSASPPAAASAAPTAPPPMPLEPEQENRTLFQRILFPVRVLMFSWMTPVVLKGYKQSLVHSDLVGSPFDINAERLYKRYLAVFNERKARGKHGIKGALWALYKWQFLLSWFLLLVSEACSMALPVFVGYITDFLIDSTIPAERPEMGRGIGLAFGLVGTVYLGAICRTHAQQLSADFGLGMRSILFAVLYNNSVRLPQHAIAELTTGYLMTLMTTDIQKLREVFMSIMQLFIGPLTIIASVTILVIYVGWYTFVGLGVMFVVGPFTSRFSKVMIQTTYGKMRFSDQRAKLFKEVIQGIRVVKSYGWEDSFMKAINAVRRKEADQLQKNAVAMAVIMPISLTIPAAAVCVTFVLRVIFDDSLPRGGDSFLALGFFTSLILPFTIIPMGIANLTQTLVSISRIDRFLGSEQIDVPPRLPPAPKGDVAVSCGPADFAWDRKSSPVLRNIKVEMISGAFTAVVGQVGSGKSSLLSALLGELLTLPANSEVDGENKEVETGSKPPGVGPSMRGKVAYVSQQAFIMNASVKANILFGQEFDARRYRKAIAVSALAPDLKLFTDGDATEIGEKGINLSGGQKQRISLARAVYANADVYLFDDPLSAVDAHVGKFIFNEMLCKYLAHKTRLLVTNQVQYLSSPEVSNIVVIGEGRIVEEGPYAALAPLGGAFSSLLEAQQSKVTEDASSVEDAGEGTTVELSKLVEEVAADEEEVLEVQEVVGSPAPAAVDVPVPAPLSLPPAPAPITRRRSSGGSDVGTPTPGRGDGTTSPSVIASPITRGESTSSPKPTSATYTKSGKLIQDESMSTGSMPWSVYGYYFFNMGNALTLAILLAMYLCPNPFRAWADEVYGEYAADQHSMSVGRFVYTYASIMAAHLISTACRALLWARTTVTTANKIHDNAVATVLRCPTSFFETTPAGRIMNRISKDQNEVDMRLPFMWQFVANMFLQICTTIGVIGYSAPWFLLAIVPVAVLYWLLRLLYRRAAVQMQRIDSVSISPVFSLYSETLGGLDSIRAYRLHELFRARFHGLVDYTSTATKFLIAATGWLRMRLLHISLLLVSACTFFIVGMRDNMDIGLAGIALVYCVNIIPSLEWFMQFSTDVEAKMNAVERLMEFHDLKEEAASRLPGDVELEKWWPRDGVVEFKNVEMRYRESLPLVLKGLTFTISRCEKVGVVGRTGAGKSSLFVTLLRLVEISGGTITIDGIELRDIGLDTLRHRLSIIPQDPVLFSGTVRSNLDPFDQYDDETVWRALRRCHMAKAIRRMRVLMKAAQQQKAAEAAAAAATKAAAEAEKKAGKKGRKAPPAINTSANTAPAAPPVPPTPHRTMPAAPGAGVSAFQTPALPASQKPKPVDVVMSPAAAADTGTPMPDLDPAIAAMAASPILAALADDWASPEAKEALALVVEEGGSNFSVGERQLLCLGRALLRQSKILLLDEATASVDPETDALIQTTIREEFRECTTITIAHRLNTIMDSDRVLVMSDGVVAEFDSPARLLADSNSIFSSLAAESKNQTSS